jgi:hypothetical protein
MSQAESRNTTNPSRRALLASAPAAAATALAAGSLVTGLDSAAAGPSAPDPIFRLIDEHQAAAEAYARAVEVKALFAAAVPN